MTTVDALLRERAGYVAAGKTNRVAQVDAELARFGVAVEEETPVETATPRRGRPPKAAG